MKELYKYFKKKQDEILQEFSADFEREALNSINREYRISALI
jgi:hypothetical protein